MMYLHIHVLLKHSLNMTYPPWERFRRSLHTKSFISTLKTELCTNRHFNILQISVHLYTHTSIFQFKLTYPSINYVKTKSAAETHQLNFFNTYFPCLLSTIFYALPHRATTVNQHTLTNTQTHNC